MHKELLLAWAMAMMFMAAAQRDSNRQSHAKAQKMVLKDFKSSRANKYHKDS